MFDCRFHETLIDFMLSRYRDHDYDLSWEKESINSPVSYTQNGDTKYVDIVLTLHARKGGEGINGKTFLIDVQPYLENVEETLRRFKGLKRDFYQDKSRFIEEGYRENFHFAVYPSRRNFILLKKREEDFLSLSGDNTSIGFPYFSEVSEVPIDIYPVVEERFKLSFDIWKNINKFVRNFHREFPETPRVEEIV